MTDERRSSLSWMVGMAVLAAVALVAIVRLRSDHRDPASNASLRASGAGPRCTALSPAEFTVAPGGRQEIAAHFSGGSGHLGLTWSASGGVLLTTLGRGDKPELVARVEIDDFDDGAVDGALWRWEAAQNNALRQKDGLLRGSLGAGNEDRVARLENKYAIDGDFAAEVTVRDVSARGNRGAAALTFVTLDGAEAHVQALSGPGYAALESNARQADGTWRTSASALYGGGPVSLRIVRAGSTFSCSFDRGRGPLPLGAFTELSGAPGYLRLETWSLDEHPAVESELDNFGAGQNTIVSWQAPDGAVPGSSYAIKLADGCEAKAVVGKPPAAH